MKKHAPRSTARELRSSGRICALCFLSVVFIGTAGEACVATAQDIPRHVSAAQSLLARVDGPAFSSLFADTDLRLDPSPLAPLARYQPRKTRNGRGLIAVGADIRRYHTDYVYIVSIMDRIDRPNFDEYLTAVAALSIANEKAHFEQDKNGSLDDFFAYQQQRDVPRLCALYGLQQHVSDVVMMVLAVRLERYFLGIGNIHGVEAVRAALDKMELKDIFEDLRQGLVTHDSARVNRSLALMKSQRSAMNIYNIPVCRRGGETTLPDDVVRRATAPARDSLDALAQLSPEAPRVSPPPERAVPAPSPSPPRYNP